MFSQSYFSLESLNPLPHIRSMMNPYHYYRQAEISNYALSVHMTNRAKQALHQLDKHLTIEMQLYFSCVVQKRIIFHDAYHPDAAPVSDNMSIIFRSFWSTSSLNTGIIITPFFV